MAGPAISNVVPQSRGQGATGQNIVITGTNFVGGSVVSFSCDGITVNSINYESSTELIVNIDIASDATIGYCAVIVTNPDGKADEDMFELTNSPEVKSANPGSLLQGAENRDVIIEGNYFVDNLPGDPNGDQLTADFGDGVIVHSVTCVNPTKLIANITVAWDAEVKDRPVKVINGDAGVGISDDDIFTVLAIGPTISIRTDKEAYQPGNEMYVYADFSNPTDESVLGIAALFLVKLHPILQLYDISFHFMLPDSETKDDVLYDGSPPVDKPWTYAWLGVLFSKKDGYLDSSVAVWSYETPLSAANTERIKRIAEEYVQNLTLNTVLTLKSAKDFEKDTAIIPAQSLLLQNTPNPFNPETWIPYKLAESTAVTIKIYNITGQLVRSLDLGQKDAGLYLSKDKAAYWDGRDNLGEKVSSGVYFYTLQAGQFRATRKMVILK